VLAGGLAFRAMHKALGPLTPALTAAGTAFKTFMERAAVQASLGGTTTAVGALSTASMGAKGAVERLGTALKVAFISNPIGIAITIIATALGAWAMANAAAQQKVQEHQQRVAELKNTLDQTNGALTVGTREMVAQSVAGDEMADKLSKAGISGQLYTQALIDGGAAAKLFNDDLLNGAKVTLEATGNASKLREQADTLGVSYETLVEHGLGYATATEKVNAALQSTTDQSGEAATAFTTAEGILSESLGTHRDVAESYRNMRDAIDEAQREQQRIREATREAAAAMTDAARSNQRMNDALAIARDVTRDATERLSALKQALDELNGGTKSQADLEQQLNDRTRSLADAFNVADESGKKLGDSLVLSTGQIDTQTEAGSRLRDQVKGLNEDYLAAMLTEQKAAHARGEDSVSLEKAREIHEGYAATLADAARQAGVAEDKISGFVEASLETPEIVAFALTDNGTIDAEKLRLLDLSRQIRDTPNKEFEVSSDDFPGLMQALAALGIEIKDLPAGQVKVRKDDGSFQTVEQALTDLARSREATITVRTFETHGTPYKPANPLVKRDQAGGMYGADGQHFAAGGMASGMFSGRMGGIWKPGVDGAMHNFAELHLGVPWEAYISGKPEFRERNIALLWETARRLGAIEDLQQLAFPSVPATQVYGTRAFAEGDMVANRVRVSAPAALAAPTAVQSQRRERRRGRTAPVIGTVVMGKDAKTNDLMTLRNMLERFSRE